MKCSICIVIFLITTNGLSEARPTRIGMSNVVIENGEFIAPDVYHYRKAMYHYRKGNKDSALTRFQFSVGFGNVKAMKYVALMYLAGDGIPKDKILGLAWLKLSAQNKDFESIKLLSDAIKDNTNLELESVNDKYELLKSEYGKVAVLKNAYRYYRRFKFQTLDQPNSIQQQGQNFIVLNEMQVMRIVGDIREYYIDIKNNYGTVIQGEIIIKKEEKKVE